jgi:hypothetical protein
MWGGSIPTGEGCFPMQSVNVANYERTWIALDQAIGGISDFDDRARVLAPAKGNILAIESEADGFRVSLRKRTSRGFADQSVWAVWLDDDGYNVVSVDDVNGKTASPARVTELNNLLWQFHRLAVEDAAAVIRN